MSNLKKFLRKNLASVIVLIALVLIAGVALVTKFSVNADTTATASLGAEVNYADEDTTVKNAGAPIVADETLDEAISTTTSGSKAVATASVTSTVFKQGLKGTYFKDKTLSKAVIARLDPTIYFAWGNSAPASGVPSNGFSARWIGFITPKYSEAYTFKIQHNDGVRLYIDNKTVVDKWANVSSGDSATDTGVITLSANQKYSIRLEYYDNVTNAAVKLYWKSAKQAEQIVPQAQLSTTYNPNPANGTGNGIIGTYFNGISFGKRITARRDNIIDFGWGTGSPMAQVTKDNFSSVWTGKVQPKFSESYTFYSKSSEGVRLWINGVKVIDKWVDQPIAQENHGAIRLEAGQKYNIRLQYYEKTGVASSRLMWSSPSQRKQIIPKTQLYSGAVVNPTPSPTKTVTKTASSTVVAGDKLTIKNGFNTVVLYSDKGLIATSSFTSKGMKVFAFNRDGKYTTHPTSALNWETNLQFMNHGIGYYVYNPGAQVDVPLNYSKAVEVATDQYMTTGWNLLGTPMSSVSTGVTTVKLDAVKRYISSGCSISSTGVASCTAKGTLQSLKDLINSKKGYAYIPVIVNGNTDKPAEAFNYISVTSANIDTVTLSTNTAFWFYIFP